MNRNILYTLLVILALSCFTLLYLWLSNTPAAIPAHRNTTSYSVKTDTISCFDSIVPIVAEAQLESPEVVNVTFSVSGKLEPGELHLEQGSSFRKGQLLYQINNREAFAALNRVKTELASGIVRLLPQIERDFPDEKNKWVRFMEELKPQFLVPALPAFKTSKERYLFMESGCADTYSRLQELEVNMTNYFYIAPFDGTVVDIFEQQGNHLSKGKPVARLARSMPYRLKARIHPADGAYFRKNPADVLNAQGDLIGKARFESKAASVNADGSVNYRFSYTSDKKRPLFHGMRVQLLLKQGKKIQLTEVPVTAVRNNNIQLLSHKTIVEKNVVVHYSEAGKVGIQGIFCGSSYLTEYVCNPNHQGHYVTD